MCRNSGIKVAYLEPRVLRHFDSGCSPGKYAREWNILPQKSGIAIDFFSDRDTNRRSKQMYLV